MLPSSPWVIGGFHAHACSLSCRALTRILLRPCILRGHTLQSCNPTFAAATFWRPSTGAARATQITTLSRVRSSAYSVPRRWDCTTLGPVGSSRCSERRTRTPRIGHTGATGCPRKTDFSSTAAAARTRRTSPGDPFAVSRSARSLKCESRIARECCRRPSLTTLKRTPVQVFFGDRRKKITVVPWHLLRRGATVALYGRRVKSLAGATECTLATTCIVLTTVYDPAISFLPGFLVLFLILVPAANF